MSQNGTCPVCGAEFIKRAHHQKYCNRKCLKKIADEKQYQKKGDKIRAANRDWKQRNKDRNAENKRKWVSQNIEKKRASTKKHRDKNIEHYRDRELLYKSQRRRDELGRVIAVSFQVEIEAND